jgi:hypothetical protein
MAFSCGSQISILVAREENLWFVLCFPLVAPFASASLKKGRANQGELQSVSVERKSLSRSLLGEDTQAANENSVALLNYLGRAIDSAVCPLTSYSFRNILQRSLTINCKSLLLRKNNSENDSIYNSF